MFCCHFYAFLADNRDIENRERYLLERQEEGTFKPIKMMILHINNVLSHQTKTHSSPYLWWRSRGGELWLILLLTRNELFSHRCSLIRISLAKSRHAAPKLDLTFLLGASDLVCAWTCEISWLLIRDSLIYRHLTLCTGQGSISLISLTRTDTRHATFFCWYFPVS